MGIGAVVLGVKIRSWLEFDARALRADPFDWFLVGGVRLPVLSGGRIRANIDVQNARQDQALRRYEKAVLTAVEEVENTLSAHTHEQRRLDTLRATVAANRWALDLAVDRYTRGLENFLSVLDAQRSVYLSEDAVAQSETRVTVALIAVYKSLGGGDVGMGDGSRDRTCCRVSRRSDAFAAVTLQRQRVGAGPGLT